MPILSANIRSELELGRPQTHQTMYAIPILAQQSSPRSYLTATEAMRLGGFRVTETSSAGDVPQLSAINDLDSDVLLLDGEELIGAKQNRVVNLSILVPASSTLTLPVSCVEAGRWRHQTPVMETSGELDALPVRRKRIDSVTKSARHSGNFKSNQTEVWEGISDILDEVDTVSSTSALRDAYVARSDQLEAFEHIFSPTENQVGILIAIEGRWTSLELFAHRDVYTDNASKIIRSNALSLKSGTTGLLFEPSLTEARNVLEEIDQVPVEQPPNPGKGSNVRFDSEHWFGSALMTTDETLHLVAYAK